MTSLDHQLITSVSAVESPGFSRSLAQVLRLYRSEMLLFLREAQNLIFVLGFPAITVLVLGGVFGSAPDDSAFEFVNPSHFYVSAYFGVMLAAIGLIMLPAHVAGYRSSGVLRRFDTAGFPSWAFAAVQFLCGVSFALLGSISLIATALLSYGVPAMQNPVRTLIGLFVGTLAFISLGVALGTVVPTGRAAQGLGLTLFFPMFLLAGAGPPPQALSATMRSISDWLPLTHVIRAAQEPWLGLGSGNDHLAIVTGILVVSMAVWVAQSARVGRSA